MGRKGDQPLSLMSIITLLGVATTVVLSCNNVQDNFCRPSIKETTYDFKFRASPANHCKMHSSNSCHLGFTAELSCLSHMFSCHRGKKRESKLKLYCPAKLVLKTCMNAKEVLAII